MLIHINESLIYPSFIGIWNDRVGVGADDVPGVCKGEVRDKIRSLWDSDEKFKDEDHKPSNGSFSSKESTWGDLY